MFIFSKHQLDININKITYFSIHCWLSNNFRTRKLQVNTRKRIRKHKCETHSGSLNHLVARHLCEGLFKLLSNCFELLLFANKFILKSVNFLLKLLNRFFCKFSSSLSLL